MGRGVGGGGGARKTHTCANTHALRIWFWKDLGIFLFSFYFNFPNRQPQLWICPFGWKKNGSSWKLNCSGDVREKPVFSPETAAKSTVVEMQARTSCLSLLSGKIPSPSPKSWLHGNKNNCNRPVFCCFFFLLAVTAMLDGLYASESSILLLFVLFFKFYFFGLVCFGHSEREMGAVISFFFVFISADQIGYFFFPPSHICGSSRPQNPLSI